MSYTKKGRTFPQGEVRMIAAESLTNQAVAERVGYALRAALAGFSSPGKRVSRMTGRHPRTIRNLLDGSNAPSAATLIELMREFDEVHQEVLRLANRSPSETSVSPEKIQQLLSVLFGECHAENNPDRASPVAGVQDDRKMR